MIEQLTPQRAGECIEQERSRNLRTPAAMHDPGRVNAPYPALALRVTLGLMFITHLYWKFEILPGGLDQWWSGLAAHGYPAFVIWYVISAEFAGALLLIPGIYTRWVSLYTLPMMLGAAQFWLVRKGFYFTAAGAELPVIWSIMLVLQAMGLTPLKLLLITGRNKVPCLPATELDHDVEYVLRPAAEVTVIKPGSTETGVFV